METARTQLECLRQGRKMLFVASHRGHIKQQITNVLAHLRRQPNTPSVVKLSERDSRALVQALQHPPQITDRLRNALEQHMREGTRP